MKNNKFTIPFLLFCVLAVPISCLSQIDQVRSINTKPVYHDTIVHYITVVQNITILNYENNARKDTIIHYDTIVRPIPDPPVVDPIGFLIPNRLEIPMVMDTNWFIQHKYYSMEYDTAQRHSLWVSYKFFNKYNEKKVDRTDAWAFDPKIPNELQSLDKKNYKSYPQTPVQYDRGHLIASEDRVFDLDANKQTFYFSNMSPQRGCFNQQMWNYLEAKVRGWAKASDCDTLYVVTGGAINPGVETIGKLESNNNVTVPKYYYKALLKRKGDSFDGIAFWFENRCYDKVNNKAAQPTHEYSMTIRELEEKTGINFFPNLRYVLPNNPNLEEEVETTRNITKWPL